jgi:hypothetical protein
MKHRRIASVVVAMVAAGGLALGACNTSDDESTPAPTGETQTEERKPDQGKQPQGGREDAQTNERKDLIRFKLDDRSQAGIADIWVTWTIKNNSSEKSTYTWDWEAVNVNGTRVSNSTELVTDVQPGQTTTGDMPTTLDSVSGIKLNITSFDRSESF